jgi:hypothetical protein
MCFLPIRVPRFTFGLSPNRRRQVAYFLDGTATISAAAASLKLLLTLLVFFTASSVASAPTTSCNSYRFTNDNGVTELSSSIPAEAANRGYSCLDMQGKVIRVVPPKLPPAEQDKREHEEEAEQAARDAGLPRQRSDEELEKLYASACDVEASRTRTILSIDTVIRSIRADLEGLKQKKRDLQDQAADGEREGLAPSADVLASLKSLDTQIPQTEQQIAKRQVEKQHAIGQFELDLDRMKQLQPAAPCAH